MIAGPAMQAVCCRFTDVLQVIQRLFSGYLQTRIHISTVILCRLNSISVDRKNAQRTDGRTDGQTLLYIEAWTHLKTTAHLTDDGQIDGRTDGQTNIPPSQLARRKLEKGEKGGRNSRDRTASER